MEKNTLIHIDNISKKYGQLQALSDFSFDVSPGERIALIGSSGAGKSTLLSILSGSESSDTGDFKVKSTDFKTLSKRDRSVLIGLIRQRFDLIEPLKVVHNVLAGHLGRWSTLKSLVSLIVPQNVESAAAALRQVGIEDKLHEKTAVLSGGEKQRVALARLLVQDPQIILADEPVASLDPERARQILDHLCAMTRSGDKVLIASMHSIDFAKAYFTRVVGLKNGRLLFDKTSEALTDRDIQALYEIESSPQGDDYE
ncbi:phosphonate ABC transporter ATP-binding protein [Fusibacter sp. JL216-2]|uniref:phosphonate ABC transporter ATP-binding protein n=1 Tax=Fusibacter sp. JL216-2 TaxID=3071453 RepID=UPI003D330623